MRTFSAPRFLILLLLAGCDRAPLSASAEPENQASGDGLIECAIAGAADFTRACKVARAEGEQLVLIVRHPDGGFRRLEVLADGGIATADGAELAQHSAGDTHIEVAIGDSRYRIPTGMTNARR